MSFSEKAKLGQKYHAIQCSRCGTTCDSTPESHYVLCAVETSWKQTGKTTYDDLRIWHISLCIKCLSEVYMRFLQRENTELSSHLRKLLWGIVTGFMAVGLIYLLEVTKGNAATKLFRVPFALVATAGFFVGGISLIAMFFIAPMSAVARFRLRRLKRTKTIPRGTSARRNIFSEAGRYILSEAQEAGSQKEYRSFLLPELVDAPRLLERPEGTRYSKEKQERKILWSAATAEKCIPGYLRRTAKRLREAGWIQNPRDPE